MNKTKIFFLFLLIVLSCILAGIIIFNKGTKKTDYEKQNTENEKMNITEKTDKEKEITEDDKKIIEEITFEYEYAVKKEMKKFYALDNYLKNPEIITEIRDTLFDLKVPAKYKNLHLDLIIGFDMIENGIKSNDDLKISTGKIKIENALNINQWAIHEK